MIQRQPVSLGRLFVRHFLWVPLIPLMVGLVFSLVGWVIVGSENRLARDGVDTVALVIDRNIRTERNSDGNNVTRYYIRYRFSPSSGETVEGRVAVSRDSYRNYEAGQSVTVRYLPDDPGTNRLAGEGSDRLVGQIIGAVGLLSLIGGAGLGWWLLRGKLSAIRAARHGEVREAEVVDHQVTNTAVNGRMQYRFRWIDAVRAEGQSTMMDYARLPAVGTVVKVYVDPRTGRGWSEYDF
jgi:hypothetical protein